MARSNGKLSDVVDSDEELEDGEIVENDKDAEEDEKIEGEEKFEEDIDGRDEDLNEEQSASRNKGKGKAKDMKKGPPKQQAAAKGKTADETAAKKKKDQTQVRKNAAEQAVLGGEFVWRKKPDPYETTLRQSKKDKSQVDCEQRIYQEIRRRYQKAEKHMIERGTIEVADFPWRTYQIRWEKFLNVDMNDAKNRFGKGKLAEGFDEETQTNESPQAPIKARQMALANELWNFGTKAYNNENSSKGKPYKFDKPKIHIGKVDLELYAGDYDEQRGRWSQLEADFDGIMGAKFKIPKIQNKRAESHKETLEKIVGDWKRWGLKVTEDLAHKNQVNKSVATDPDLLRLTPKNAIYIAVDKKHKLIVFLIPDAIQDAFKDGLRVKRRMEVDTMHLYTHIKTPKLKSDDKRHQDPSEEPSEIEKRRYKHVGTDHYGVWYPPSHSAPKAAMIETSESLENPAIIRQALLHYIEGTGGVMTKLLDFWFGVWDPELREEYREVYRNAPKFARLPRTNKKCPETYTLRAYGINRSTDHHKDHRDWVGGLAGIVCLGEFEGGQMCLPELGLRLEGYQSGAMLLFRGAELHHYVAPWNHEEGFRYCFEHTTHEDVHKATLHKKPYSRYKEPKFSEKDGGYQAQADLEDEEDSEPPTKGRPTRSKRTPEKGKSATGKAKGDDEGDDSEYGDDDSGTSATTKATTGKVKEATGKTRAAAPSTQQPEKTPPIRRSPRTTTPSPRNISELSTRGITKSTGKLGRPRSCKSPNSTSSLKKSISEPAASPPLRRSPRNTTPSPGGITKPTGKSGSRRSPKSSISISSSKKSTSKPATRANSKSPTSSGGSPVAPATRSGSRAQTSSSSSDTPLMIKSRKKRRAEEVAEDKDADEEPTSSPKRGKRPKLDDVSDEEAEIDQDDDENEGANVDGGDEDDQDGEKDEDEEGEEDEGEEDEGEEDEGEDDGGDENDPESSKTNEDEESKEVEDDEGAESEHDQEDEGDENANDDQDNEILKSQDNSDSARSSGGQDNGTGSEGPRVIRSTTWSTYWYWGNDRDRSTGTPGGHPTQSFKGPRAGKRLPDDLPDEKDDETEVEAEEKDEGEDDDPRPTVAGKRPPEHIPDASDASQPEEEDLVEEDAENDPNDQLHSPRGYAVKRPPKEEEALADDEDPVDSPGDESESAEDDGE